MTEFPEGTLGRYRLVSLLGEGGMGKVYKGFDSALERHVAIKILPAEVVADPKRVARFVQEARAASALNHPHVVAVYDIGEADNVRYIAMELIEGKSLRDMSGTPLEIRKALRFVLQVAEALTAAHAAGIVHRDLKPDNIMVTQAGYAKVLDFGLAKLRVAADDPIDDSRTMAKETDPGTVMGTVGYMSPEQAQGRVVDSRSDLFSLGCVLYELVTGQRAFKGSSSIDTLHKIIHSDPESVRTVRPEAPPELARILRKALAKEPDDRYQTARDFALDIRELLREVESSPSGSAVAIEPKVKRSWWPLAIAAAVIATIAIGFVIFRTRSHEPAKADAPAAAVQISRVTASGKVIAAAISPDGKFVTYVISDQGTQSLWLKQMSSGQTLELIPSQRIAYWGVTFAPDGSIYYGTKTNDNPAGAINQISALGGSPRTVITGIDSQPAFSADGKKMIFLRARHPSPNESAIIEADTNGSNERTLASVRAPEFFVPMFYAGASWAPDGKSIAAAVMDRQKIVARVVSVDVATGAIKTLAQGDWSNIGQVAWLPNGSGLVLIAQRGAAESHVWFIRMPEATATPITTDLLDYRIVSPTADSKSLLTVAAEGSADIYIAPNGAAPKKLSIGRMDGSFGVDVAADGRIVFTSLDAGKLDIWTMSSDGTSRSVVTRDEYENRYPVFTPDGKSVVYVSVTPKQSELCIINVDGSGRRVLAEVGPYCTSDVSPDGRWVVFDRPQNASSGQGVVERIPIEGGKSEPLTDVESQRPRFSPDGTRVALYVRDPKKLTRHLAVVDLATKRLTPLESAPPFAGSDIRWTPDGKALVENTAPGDRANLWLVPVDGSAPRRITQFDERLMMSFAPLPGAKGWVFSRGELSRDAVLITGFER